MFLAEATFISALVPPAPTPSVSTPSTISNPGEILIINGDPCDNCIPQVDVSNAYSNSFVDEKGTTQITIMYQAAQAVTPVPPKIETTTSMQPQATAFVVTGTESAAASIATSSQKSHVSGSTQMLSGSAHSNLSTGLSTIITTHNSHAPSIKASSTSSGRDKAQAIRARLAFAFPRPHSNNEPS